ncbi:MAG: hypothetical protein LBV51_02840 [Acholeplasmatales bacterium]|jgi:hypothetical protein|nr:hypothetical protein [Acholeplasmatales bacterium]
MQIFLELWKNSSVFGAILVTLMFVITITLGVYLVFQSVRTAGLYILDGGDARVPCFISYTISYLIALIALLRGFMIGYISPESCILVGLSYLTLVAMLLRGRILWYPTTVIKPIHKTLLHYFNGLLIVLSIIFVTVFYNSQVGIIMVSYNYDTFITAVYSFLVATLTPSYKLSLALFVPCIIISIFTIIFDKLEKRENNILLDVISLIPSILYLGFGLTQKSIPFYVTPIYAIIFAGILFIAFLLAKTESEDIIYKTKGINTLIVSTNKLITKIAHNKNHNANDAFRFDQVYKIIESDIEVRVNVFGHPGFSKERRRLVERLRAVYEDPSRLIPVRVKAQYKDRHYTVDEPPKSSD